VPFWALVFCFIESKNTVGRRILVERCDDTAVVAVAGIAAAGTVGDNMKPSSPSRLH
jgi:hypothetical protein